MQACRIQLPILVLLTKLVKILSLVYKFLKKTTQMLKDLVYCDLIIHHSDGGKKTPASAPQTSRNKKSPRHDDAEDSLHLLFWT